MHDIDRKDIMKDMFRTVYCLYDKIGECVLGIHLEQNVDTAKRTFNHIIDTLSGSAVRLEDIEFIPSFVIDMKHGLSMPLDSSTLHVTLKGSDFDVRKDD